MSNTQLVRRKPWVSPAAASAESAVIALAARTCLPIALVKTLYDREVAVLQAQARIRRFISVLACKRVKHYLRAYQAGDPKALRLACSSAGAREQAVIHIRHDRERAGDDEKHDLNSECKSLPSV